MRPTNKWLKLLSQRVLLLSIPFFLVLIIISCQRTIEPKATTNEFNADAAKEWYYGTFKKSAEWASSPEHGKKLPNWSQSFYKKIGGMEAIEFPLVSTKKTVLIPSTEILTDADKRITESALAKISFIRKANKVIEVRETSYVPTLQYLQKHQYDISHASLLKPDNDFSGQIIIRNWKGKILSIKKMQNGKVTGSIQVKERTIPRNDNTKSTAATSEDCEPLYECIFVLVCDETIYPDQLITYTNCVLENTGECWPANNCPPDGGDGCVGLTPEECACQSFGICDDGDEDEDGDGDDQACSMTQAEGQALLDNITLEQTSTFSSVLGPESIDGNGIIRRPKPINWEFITIHMGLGANPQYTANFSGVVYKMNQNDRWKWEACTYSNVVLSRGQTPVCISVTPTASASIAVGDYETIISLSATFNATVSCLFGVSVGRPLTSNQTSTFYSE